MFYAGSTILQNSPIESMCSLIDSQLASAFSILSDADIISLLVVKLYISFFDSKHKSQGFHIQLLFILDNEIMAEFGFGWYDSSETMLNKSFSLNLSSFGL